MEFGSGLEVNRCNCPLAQDERQCQIVSNLTKVLGQPHGEVRHRHPPRLQPARAERHPPVGRDRLQRRTGRSGPSGGGLGLATFLLGDVTVFRRFVSTSTDATRERSGASSTTSRTPGGRRPKLTLNYGLRLEDIYNPQTVNEAGNGGWLDINTGEMQVGGVGDIDLDGNVKNKVNWAPRLGVTYQVNEKTVIRAGLRPQLRHRRLRVHLRPRRHPEPARCSRIQQLNAPNNYDARLQPRGRARRPRPSSSPAPTAASSCPTGSRLASCPPRCSAARPSTPGT